MVKANDRFFLYFGCWDEPGHYLFNVYRKKVADSELSRFAMRPEQLDGSKIFLPYPEVPGDGRLTHLVRDGACITVLAWWDRTFDKRSACCAAVQCDGWETFDALWERFSHGFKPLAEQVSKPRLPFEASE